MCACVCMSYVCMCACWGIFVTLMAFISGQWNAAKTFFLLSCCSYTDTPMNAHSTYIPCKKTLLFLLCVHPMGSSSVLIQYLHIFFFLRPRKSLRCTLGRVRGCRAASSPLCLLTQRPPRSHEREEHAAAWGAGSGMQSSSRGQGQPAEQLKLCPGGEAESRAGGQGEKVAGRGTAVAGLLLWRKSCWRGACLQKAVINAPPPLAFRISPPSLPQCNNMAARKSVISNFLQT